ncbi:g4251 [Coccomyxa viridis]|uniref:G4251 protein n=1 Tax=Coccomyxa viridis TaxID=1274662 RepID=A0ABP1FS67_9CHLO
MMGARELSCSLKKFNPGIPLIILSGTEDDINSRGEELSKLGMHRTVEDISFENRIKERFGLNWIKLRVWEWIEYDALIVIDADAIVQANITHLFGLPTDFAWVTHNGEGGFDANRGGFLMVRPCIKTFYSMMHYLHSHKHYQFETSYAEQDFLTWYYRYTAFDLPGRYNVNFGYVDEHGMGPDGTKAAVLHFADDRHKDGFFRAQPGSDIWPYLCYQPQHTELETI